MEEDPGGSDGGGSEDNSARQSVGDQHGLGYGGLDGEVPSERGAGEGDDGEGGGGDDKVDRGDGDPGGGEEEEEQDNEDNEIEGDRRLDTVVGVETASERGEYEEGGGEGGVDDENRINGRGDLVESREEEGEDEDLELEENTIKVEDSIEGMEIMTNVRDDVLQRAMSTASSMSRMSELPERGAG